MTKSCSNCRFYHTASSSHPCDECLKLNDNYATYWRPAEDGWIPVTDRLPPMVEDNTSDVVLVVIGARTRSNWYQTLARLEWWDKDEPPRWYDAGSEHWHLGNDVTHYRPLPPFPEE